MAIWKFFCMKKHNPGLWQSWLDYNCVAVGWPPLEFPLHAHADARWADALNRIEVGDQVVVHLPGRRFGRVGEVAGKAIEDHEWNPLIPGAVHPPHGEMGRRVFVGWDLNIGPPDAGQVVLIPEGIPFPFRGAVGVVATLTWPEIVAVMNDQGNWVNGPA